MDSQHKAEQSSASVDHCQRMETFRDNVDAWIKQIRREFSEFSELPGIMQEHAENIQHNYELIYELRDEVDELKQEINALKLIQIIALKNKGIEEQQSIDKVKLN